MKKLKFRSIIVLFLLVFLTQGYGQLSDKTIYVQPATDANMVSIAEELANYLYQIEGNIYMVNITDEFNETGILLALTSETDNISTNEISTLNGMNGESFLLDANSLRVKIVGNHYKAVSHGMFSFLKELGCYFLSPAEDWTIIPNTPNWNLVEYKFDEPDFLNRNIWYANGDGWGYDDVLDENHFDREVFFRATQQGWITQYIVGHSYQDDLAEAPAEFQNHPEWFGTREDGTLYTWQDYVDNGAGGISLEYSDLNLGDLMLQHRIEWLQQYQAENLDARVISMEPNDGSDISYSQASLNLGNKADQVLHLANHVANNITNTIPDAIVSIYCYGGSLEAPLNLVPASNIYGEMAMAFNPTDKSFNEMATNWLNTGLQQFGVYEYWGEYQWDFSLPHCQPTVSLKQIKERIDYMYNTWGSRYINVESQANWGRGGPSYYVARKLLWDVNADADALYDEYLNKAFGNAANTMKLLYQDWEYGYKNLQPEDLNHIMLNKWITLISQALNQVSPGTAEYKRIEDVYAYIHLVLLVKEYFDVERVAELTNDFAAARAAALPVLEFAYRLRHRQMIQFWAFQFRFIWERPLLWDAPEEEAGWDFFNMHITPTIWMDNGDDFTSAELQSLLAEDMVNYLVDPLVRTYSSNLVPLYPELTPTSFTPQHQQMDTNYAWGVDGYTNWYIYSEDGQATDIEIIKGNVGQGFTAEIGRLTIKSEEDNSVIFDQSPAVDYEYGELDIQNVTNLQLDNGLYHMEIQNWWSENYYFPKFDSPKRFVVEASIENPIDLHLWINNPDIEEEDIENLYFYVPEDVDVIYLHHNYLLSIQAPSMSEPMYYDWTETGFLEIPINNEEDKGVLWKIGSDWTYESNFYFLNVPPYLSNSPENMLVPETTTLSTAEPQILDFSVSPNPTTGQVNVSFTENIESQIFVLDIVGRRVFQKPVNGSSVSLDLSHLSNGTYIIGLKNYGEITGKKIIIQK